MDEKELVQRLQAGDRGAFELLVKLHFRAAYNLAFQFMGDHGGADEVVQESFLKAYNAIGSFRGESAFKSWLLRITVNTAKNALRSRGRREMVSVDEVALGKGHADFNRLENWQTGHLLKRAIEQLPPKQRRVLELRIYDDLPFKEIAEIVESPFDTAKANFRHAVMNLKKILEATDEGRGLEEMRQAFQALAEDDGYEP
jgi:RNA polymerase sigma-70 factor, ECF subfamily